ncbi:hypothetical protein LINPERHAP2_LOCUS5335 [Linum perenne]
MSEVAKITSLTMGIEPAAGFDCVAEHSMASRDCWRLSGLESLVNRFREDSESFEEWAAYVLADPDEKVVAGIMSVIWAIWRERNNRVWRQQSNTATRVVSGAKEALEDWLAAQTKRDDASGSVRVERCSRWHPPPHGQLKINVDAAVFSSNGRTGAEGQAPLRATVAGRWSAVRQAAGVVGRAYVIYHLSKATTTTGSLT